MMQFGNDRERGTAMDMLPALKAALWNIVDEAELVPPMLKSDATQESDA